MCWRVLGRPSPSGDPHGRGPTRVESRLRLTAASDDGILGRVCPAARSLTESSRAARRTCREGLDSDGRRLCAVAPLSRSSSGRSGAARTDRAPPSPLERTAQVRVHWNRPRTSESIGTDHLRVYWSISESIGTDRAPPSPLEQTAHLRIQSKPAPVRVGSRRPPWMPPPDERMHARGASGKHGGSRSRGGHAVVENASGGNRITLGFRPVRERNAEPEPWRVRVKDGKAERLEPARSLSVLRASAPVVYTGHSLSRTHSDPHPVTEASAASWRSRVPRP